MRPTSRLSRPIWLLLATVVALLVPLASASATAPSGGGRTSMLVEKIAHASDPRGAFADLSVSDRAAVIEYAKVTTTVDSSSLQVDQSVGVFTAAAGGCWTWTWRRDGKNVLGATLWSYFQKIDWCGDGSTITTTPQRLRWGETYFPFWSWKHIGNQTWGGVGQASYRAWTQGEFKLCATPDVGCVQFSYPWLDMTAWADGRGTGSVGG